MNQLALEFEFDNLAQLEEFWDEWRNSERPGPFFEEWNTIVESDGQHDLWHLK
jgi:hypothetical protein